MFGRRATDFFWRLCGGWRKLPAAIGTEGQTLVLDSNLDFEWGAAGTDISDEPFLTFAADSGALTNNRVVVAGASGWIVLTDAGSDDGDFEIEIGEITDNVLLGRANGDGTGVPQVITLGTGLTMTGNVLAASGGGGGPGAPVNATYVCISNDATLTNERALAVSGGLALSDGGADASVTLSIANDGVTFAKMQEIASGTIIGLAGLGPNNPEAITVNTAHLSFFTGGTIDQFGIANNAVTDALLRQSAALSVIGRSANSTGNVADISAGTDHFVLRRSGTSLGFGLIVTNNITDDNVTLGKIANAAANSVLVGSGSAGTGTNYTEITLGAGLAMTGTVLSSSLTQYTDELAQDAVGTIFTDSSEINFTYDDGTPSITGSLIDGSIALARLANLATQRVIGRNSGGTGVPEAVTASQLLDWVGSTLGSILYRDSGGWNVLGPSTSGFFLKTQGAGTNPVWAAVAATPAGSNTQIQYNNAGAFGAEAAFTYNASTNTMGVDVINLPTTTSAAGLVKVNGTTTIHFDGGNIFVGAGAGNTPGTGQSPATASNVGIGNGVMAPRLNSAQYCTGLGDDALGAMTGAQEATAIGAGAGSGNTTGNSNTFVGVSAGATVTYGSNNSFLGRGADTDSEASTFRTAIGSDSEVGANDTIALGRSADSTVIGGSVARAKLDVRDGAIYFDEMSEPDAPGADEAVLFCRDNGFGKTQLCVRFNTGAIQVVATQP